VFTEFYRARGKPEVDVGGKDARRRAGRAGIRAFPWPSAAPRSAARCGPAGAPGVIAPGDCGRPGMYDGHRPGAPAPRPDPAPGTHRRTTAVEAKGPERRRGRQDGMKKLARRGTSRAELKHLLNDSYHHALVTNGTTDEDQIQRELDDITMRAAAIKADAADTGPATMDASSAQPGRTRLLRLALICAGAVGPLAAAAAVAAAFRFHSLPAIGIGFTSVFLAVVGLPLLTLTGTRSCSLFRQHMFWALMRHLAARHGSGETNTTRDRGPRARWCRPAPGADRDLSLPSRISDGVAAYCLAQERGCRSALIREPQVGETIFPGSPEASR